MRAEGLVRRVVRKARGRVGPEVRLARLLGVRQVRCGMRRRLRQEHSVLGQEVLVDSLLDMRRVHAEVREVVQEEQERVEEEVRDALVRRVRPVLEVTARARVRCSNRSVDQGRSGTEKWDVLDGGHAAACGVCVARVRVRAGDLQVRWDQEEEGWVGLGTRGANDQNCHARLCRRGETGDARGTQPEPSRFRL